MAKVDLYTIKGIKTGELSLPKDFGEKVNVNLLAQAIRVYEDNSHPGLRKTKTRSEVNRTTKKLYRQKGTGGARHGSRRANLFVGGGVSLGPRPIRRILELPDKMKARAKFMAFNYKLGEKSVIAVSGLSKVEKTKEPASFLAKLKDLKSKSFTFVLSDKMQNSRRFFRNIRGVKVVAYKEASALDIFKGGELILDADIFEAEKSVKSKDVKKAKK